MNRNIFLLTICFLSSCPAFASGGKVYWQPDGVLCTGIAGMGIGDLVTDMRGGAYNVTGDLNKVYAIRVDRNGNLPWGLGGVIVDTGDYPAQMYTTKGVSDGKGGVIVVWERLYPWAYKIYYQRIDSNGNRMWGGSGNPLTLSDSSQEYHQVVSDGRGGVIVAWQEMRNGQYDIYAQRVDSTGARQWGVYGKIVCNATNNQECIHLDCDSTSYSVISWADYRNVTPRVYADRMDGNGNSLWQINGKIICNTDSGQSMPNYGKSVTYTSDHNIIMVWHDMRNGNLDVYSQCLNTEGNNIWVITGIPVCDTINLQGSAQIVPDKRNGAIICWIDQRNGNKNIYAQSLNDIGQYQWSRQGIPICLSDNVNWYHKMTDDGNNGAMMCWQDSRSGNSDIYSQHVDSNGNVKWDLNGMGVCKATGNQQYPFIIPYDSGTAIIAWQDGRYGSWRGFVQKVGDDPNGISYIDDFQITIGDCKMEHNRPNPFKKFTTISYQLSAPGKTRIKIFNISGQLVNFLIDQYQLSGYHRITWDGRDENGNVQPNGIYFCALQIGAINNKTIKITKIK